MSEQSQARSKGRTVGGIFMILGGLAIAVQLGSFWSSITHNDEKPFVAFGILAGLGLAAGGVVLLVRKPKAVTEAVPAAATPVAAKPKVPTPPWAWAFVVACGVIPVITLGGALFGALGFGAAGACIGVAKKETMSVAARVAVCAAITVVAWLVFLVLLVSINRMRAHR